MLNEFISAAADETIVLQVLASAALALGKLVNLSGAAITTGTVLSAADADALTTGTIATFKSNSADTSTRTLMTIHNDNTAATGTTPLTITQDAVTATKFKKVLKLGGATIYYDIDNTEPEGALTGVKGDVCLNVVGGSIAFCDADGTNWTTLS